MLEELSLTDPVAPGEHTREVWVMFISLYNCFLVKRPYFSTLIRFILQIERIK